jgi:hypothetical protein
VTRSRGGDGCRRDSRRSRTRWSSIDAHRERGACWPKAFDATMWQRLNGRTREMIEAEQLAKAFGEPAKP